MKYILIQIFLFFFYVYAVGQKLPDGDWDIFDADILGHLYISDGTELKMLQTNGVVLAEYQDQLLGDIYQIDCFKGLKILIYHKVTNNVVILDNQLAPLGQAVDLSDGGFYDVSAVCLGTDDRLWIADEQSGQLKSVDRALNVIQTGVVFRQYTSADKINQFAKRGNLLLMVTSDNELLVFDHFGSFVNKHSFKELEHSWIGSRSVFYVSENQALRFSYEWSSFDTIMRADKQLNGIFESKNQLYLLQENRIIKLKN